ncbi:MAG: ATP-binding protein [Moraxella sp.]|nr:ATP-binding protein [Moraxella sp.]
MSSDGQVGKVSAYKKYRGLIILVISFLVLTTGLLALNMSMTRQFTKFTAVLDASHQQGNLVQELSKNLVDMNLYLDEVLGEQGHGNAAHEITAESQNNAVQVVKLSDLPQSAIYRLQEIADEKALYERTLKAFQQGGTTLSSTGQEVEITAIETNPVALESLKNAQEIWTPYLGLLDNFLTDSQRGVLSKQTSDYLVDYTRLYNKSLQTEADILSSALNSEVNKRADILQIVQAVGIATAFILFVLIIFGALRQLVGNDALLEAARKETTNIMRTVNTGLFLLDKELVIGTQHSEALEGIIGTDRIAGESLTSVLRNRVSDKDLQTAEQFLKQLYNPRVDEELVQSLNPLNKVMLHNTDQDTAESRYLDFVFSRVHEGEDISQILVSVNDVSEAVRLEQRLERERAQNDMQLEMLATILNVSPSVTNDFITNTHTHIERMNNVLKNPGSSQFELENKLRAIYREMHSLKGEASALNLHSFTKIATEAENKLQTLQNQGRLAGNDFLPLTVHLDELLNLSNVISGLGQRINSVNADIKSAMNTNSAATAQAYAQTRAKAQAGAQAQQAQAQVQAQPSDELSLVSTDIGLDTHDLSIEQTQPDARQTLGEYLVKFGADIAARQGKNIHVDIEAMNGQYIPQNLSVVVRELCVQLLRNAVVHGIADTQTRLALGKPAQGRVVISVQDSAGDNKDNFVFSVEDDGQGIDYDTIREKLINSGRYPADKVIGFTKGQLLNTLFSSGFSTKDSADEDGGRGVGLDIVKERVKEYGGKINVDSKKGEFARFVIRLPIPKDLL